MWFINIIKSITQTKNMKIEIEIEIPKPIINRCKELGIPKSVIPKVFIEYLKHLLGVNNGATSEDYNCWVESNFDIIDNIMDKFESKNDC